MTIKLKNPYLRYKFTEREEQWQRVNVLWDQRQCGERSVRVMSEWGSELLRSVRLNVLGERVLSDWCISVCYKILPNKTLVYKTWDLCGFSLRKSSLKDSVLICRTRVFKTRDLCGIIVSNSSSTKRVFKYRVSKTWDASLLKPFKCVLTYYILSLYYASP